VASVSASRPRGNAGDPRASDVTGQLSCCILCGALGAIGGSCLAGAGVGTRRGHRVIRGRRDPRRGGSGGYGRWLVLPRSALALPVAFVSAANIDPCTCGAGTSSSVPTSAAQLRDSYRSATGRYVVDLRDANFSAW